MKARSLLWVWTCLVALLVSIAPARAEAHEFRPGVLTIEADAGRTGRYRLRWQNGASAGATLPGEELRVVVTGGCEINGSLPIATIDCGGGTLRGRLRVEGLSASRREVFVQLRDGDSRRSFLLTLSQPELALGLDDDARGLRPKSTSFRAYFELGLRHIAGGYDHLLFVLLLVVAFLLGPTREDRSTTRELLVALTGFTLAHSLTLGALVLGWVHTSHPMVEAWIAASLAVTSAEIARAWRADEASKIGWLLACVFGLVHGLGFAGALGELGLAGEARWRSLLAFNLGIEAGQLSIVALMWVPWRVLRGRRKGSIERVVGWGTWPRLMPLYAIGTVAVAWTIERVLFVVA